MSGITQYPRKLALVVAKDTGQGIDFTQFRVVFQVRKGDFQSPNSLDVRVYNLSTDQANLLKGKESEFTRIVLQAGYEGNFGTIFQGTIRQARLGRINQLDSYVDFTASDGDEAYNFAPISEALANAKPTAVLASLLQAMRFHGGVSQGFQPTLPQTTSVRPRILWGAVKDEARSFAAVAGCTWSIQEGLLTLIPQNAYIPGDAPVLSPSTGMIGVPEQLTTGIAVRVLLNPNIKIGHTVRIDGLISNYRYSTGNLSEKDNSLIEKQNKRSDDGFYYVMSAEHQGDTRGALWFTDLVCMAADATVNLDVQDALFATDTAAVRRFD